MLNMSDLGRAVLCARDLPKLDRDQMSKYRDLTLDKWTAESIKEQQQTQFANTNFLSEAFWSIAGRHKDLNGKQHLVD